MSQSEIKSVLIQGLSKSGKSHSLKGLSDNLTEEEQKRVLYINCENGKELPFKNSFKQVKLNVRDPQKLLTTLSKLEKGGSAESKFDYVIADSITFFMDNVEHHIYHHTDITGYDRWNEYNRMAMEFMDSFTRMENKIFIGIVHVKDHLNENTGDCVNKAPIKASIGDKGIESRFTNVIRCENLSLKKIEKFSDKIEEVTGKSFKDSDLFNLSQRDQLLGRKNVFRTLPAEESTISTPEDMFELHEAIIDNNIWPVIQRIKNL